MVEARVEGQPERALPVLRNESGMLSGSKMRESSVNEEVSRKLANAIQTNRLLETAIRLIEVPSPTRSAADVSDRLDQILRGDDFSVERPAAGWPDAPAVVSKFTSGLPGRTLQYNGHLDTVHLPFVPPQVENGMLYGSGCSDMKGGYRGVRRSDAGSARDRLANQWSGHANRA